MSDDGGILYNADGTVAISTLKGGMRDVPFLQEPKHDTIVRRVRIPDKPGDQRLYLHIDDLENMLRIARSSPSQRVVIHDLGLVVETRQTKTGHRYDVVAFEGRAVPEWTGREQTLLAREGRS